MKRRAPTNAPSELAAFRLEDWPSEGEGEFERYESALHAWMEARADFEGRTGWDGDWGWWMASHEAIMAMPDQPLDPADL